VKIGDHGHQLDDIAKDIQQNCCSVVALGVVD